jgi:alanine dehydrogenase
MRLVTKKGRAMKIGVPREIKNHEYRVAITPAGVHELIRHGHEVFVEHDAGVGSSISNEEYAAAGAKILKTADEVWQTGEMIMKVKEPVKDEWHRMREGQVLFTYLHLAADKGCTDALIEKGVTGIAYETVELPDHSLPLLAPMSEVAGRLAPQVGAYSLMRANGGRGALLGGVPGTRPAKVVVLGGGVSGLHSAVIAMGMEFKSPEMLADPTHPNLNFISDTNTTGRARLFVCRFQETWCQRYLSSGTDNRFADKCAKWLL